MPTTWKMKPPGTGLCVRYRYDETRRRRWKTVELIVEESDWEPATSRRQEDPRVAIQVAAQERGVRQQVKAAGGKGNPRGVVWELPYGQAVALGLTGRIVTKADEWGKEAHLHIEGSARESPSTYREDESHIPVDRSIYI